MTQWQEASSPVVSFGKVGDTIEGTLADIHQREVRDDKKGLVKKNLYDIKVDEGFFHTLDDNKQIVEPAVVCEKGDLYTIWGGKDVIDGPMRKAKIGQKVKFVFAQQLEPKKKGYSGFKIIKIYFGPMDEEFLSGKEPSLADYEV